MNLYLLLIFGPQVERIVGTPRFLALYLLTGAFGFLASLLGMPGTLSVGASASLFGLVGFALHYRLRASGRRWMAIDTMLAQVIVINLIAAFFMPDLDHFAHAGGFIAGGLAFSLAKPAGYEPPSRRRRWEARGAAFLLVAFAFAALYPLGASAVFLPVHPAWARALAAGYQVHHLAYRIADPEFRWVYTEEPERIMDPGARLVIQRDRRMQSRMRVDIEGTDPPQGTR